MGVWSQALANRSRLVSDCIAAPTSGWTPTNLAVCWCHMQVFGLEEGRGAAGGVKVTQGAGQGAKVGVEALAALVSAVVGSPPAKGRTLEVRRGAWEA